MSRSWARNRSELGATSGACPTRSVEDIAVTGAAWVTESELAWLCSCASSVAELEAKYKRLVEAAWGTLWTDARMDNPEERVLRAVLEEK